MSSASAALANSATDCGFLLSREEDFFRVDVLFFVFFAAADFEDGAFFAVFFFVEVFEVDAAFFEVDLVAAVAFLAEAEDDFFFVVFPVVFFFVEDRLTEVSLEEAFFFVVDFFFVVAGFFDPRAFEADFFFEVVFFDVDFRGAGFFFDGRFAVVFLRVDDFVFREDFPADFLATFPALKIKARRNLLCHNKLRSQGA